MVGLLDWIAGKVAGPSAYGKVLGRRTVMEGGRGLANSAFFNHGTRPKELGVTAYSEVFESVSDMEAAGFKPRYEDTFKITAALLSVDEQVLYRNLHIAMVAFAHHLIANIASSMMCKDNSARFCDGLTDSVSREVVACGLYGQRSAVREALVSHTRLFRTYEAAANPAIMDLANPACGDFLEFSLITFGQISGAQSQYDYAFARTGACSLKNVAVPLFEETIKSILGATQHYNWRTVNAKK